MATKKELNQLIENARNELYDKNHIAFLGEVLSGKTVASAFFKHALFNYFVPKSRGKYEAIVIKGSDTINDTLKYILKESIFPPTTWPIERRTISIEIHTMKGRGPPKIQLVLKDISGEKYTEFLTKEYDDSEKRLYDILTFNKNDDEKVGPLAHLVFSKIYVIIIDCQKQNVWQHEQSYAAQMITALRQIKELVKDSDNGKIRNPIAVMFTKTDLLDEKERKIPAEELMKKMPEFISSLNISHNGLINYFKMFVDAEEESQVDINSRLIHEEEAARSAFEKKKEDRERTIQQAIQKAGNDAKNKAISEGKNEQQANPIAEAAKKETESAFRNEPQEEFHFDREKYSKPTQKVKLPLRYSHSEYIRFISWILKNITR